MSRKKKAGWGGQCFVAEDDGCSGRRRGRCIYGGEGLANWVGLGLSMTKRNGHRTLMTMTIGREKKEREY